ncbi:MAG TPA: transporter [Gemmatimonadales bacterium]
MAVKHDGLVMRDRRSAATVFVMRIGLFLSLILLILLPDSAVAQDNYEIQVYGSETMAPGITMFELHSNFTDRGERSILNGLAPTNHAVHETLEITHGFNEWFEVGFYTFTSIEPGESISYVGNHIRPRFRVPPSWHWPVGVSISQEIGFQHRRFSEETWSWEIRPIIDHQAGKLYWSINPTLGVPLAGDSTLDKGVQIQPNVAITYDVSPVVNLGVEYYGELGTFSHIEPARRQVHAVYPVVNLNFSKDWEVNAGVGFGLTPATDPLVFKLILGYRAH